MPQQKWTCKSKIPGDVVLERPRCPAVAGLAAATGLSRAAFAARFTSQVGAPPLTYLTAWRMTIAADLLHDTDATVAAIAREVGYDDAFAFSAAFKRAHHTSPSAWRRRPR